MAVTPVNKIFPMPPLSNDNQAWRRWGIQVRQWQDQFVIDFDPPGPIPSYQAESSNLTVLLSWEPAKKAWFYDIYRGLSGDFAQASFIRRVSASKTKIARYTFQDSQDFTQPTRYYWIVPLNERGISGPMTAIIPVTNFSVSSTGTAGGVNARATGLNAVAFGTDQNVSGDNSVGIGFSGDIQGDSSVGIGNDVSIVGDFGVGIGKSANIANGGVGIGFNVSVNDGGVGIGGNVTVDTANAIQIGVGSNLFDGTIGLGNVEPTASGQFIASWGGAQPITDVYFGDGVTNSAPTGFTLHGTGGISGTNKDGAPVSIAGGISTGAGSGGAVTIQTSPVGSSGSTPNVLVNRLQVDTMGNIICGISALPTATTNGFLYVPTCQGTPSGIPQTYTGRSALIVDTSSGRIYAYYGGAWHFAALT